MASSGACHCGALSVVYRTALPLSAWSVRACQCAFCLAHAALSTSDPAGELAFAITEPTLLNRYRFARRTADFLLCRRCGIYVGATIDATEGRFGIVNVRTLRLPSNELPAPVAVDYDAESTAQRVGRRVQRWTPLATGSL